MLRPLFLIVMFACGPLTGADFQIGAVVRAGLPTPGDWELGLGAAGNAPAATAHLNPYYGDNTPQRFEIGYRQSTNTAFLRFYNQPSGATQITYTIPYPVTPTGSFRWEIPAGSLYVRAASVNRPTSVTIDQLSLSGALTVLQPLQSASLTASQFRSDMTTGTAAPVVFVTAGGDWTLTGRIRFAGLSAHTNGGARRSELHMGFTVLATHETPEPSTLLLAATGLVLLAVWRKRA